jgi:polyisoprenoid-binding protein YceI
MSATLTTIPTGTWAIDPVHSAIGFAVKHLGVSTFRGTFTAVTGAIVTADGAVTSVNGEVEIASVATRDANLAGHLQGEDFFDAANHPKATFASTSISQSGDDVTIVGDLTLRGITKTVELAGQVTGAGADPYGNEKVGIEVRGTIDRTEFGVSWNVPLANGVLTVAERVTLELDVQAVKS